MAQALLQSLPHWISSPFSFGSWANAWPRGFWKTAQSVAHSWAFIFPGDRVHHDSATVDTSSNGTAVLILKSFAPWISTLNPHGSFSHICVPTTFKLSPFMSKWNFLSTPYAKIHSNFCILKRGWKYHHQIPKIPNMRALLSTQILLAPKINTFNKFSKSACSIWETSFKSSLSFPWKDIKHKKNGHREKQTTHCR